MSRKASSSKIIPDSSKSSSAAAATGNFNTEAEITVSSRSSRRQAKKKALLLQDGSTTKVSSMAVKENDVTGDSACVADNASTGLPGEALHNAANESKDDNKNKQRNAMRDAARNNGDTNHEDDTAYDDLVEFMAEWKLSIPARKKSSPDARIDDDNSDCWVRGRCISEFTDASDEPAVAEYENSKAAEAQGESNVCAATSRTENVSGFEDDTSTPTVPSNDTPLPDDGTPKSYDEHMMLYTDLLSDSLPDDPAALTNGRTDITSGIDASCRAPYYNLRVTNR
ncbi:hypothetical protein BZA77DRAFT_349565 [Pyronema omphalodes]|nr:hypothetical protein BZA77DRAFT_349565 [Pyronema omphalodes]